MAALRRPDLAPPCERHGPRPGTRRAIITQRDAAALRALAPAQDTAALPIPPPVLGGVGGGLEAPTVTQFPTPSHSTQPVEPEEPPVLSTHCCPWIAAAVPGAGGTQPGGRLFRVLAHVGRQAIVTSPEGSMTVTGLSPAYG